MRRKEESTRHVRHGAQFTVGRERKERKEDGGRKRAISPSLLVYMHIRGKHTVNRTARDREPRQTLPFSKIEEGGKMASREAIETSYPLLSEARLFLSFRTFHPFELIHRDDTYRHCDDDILLCLVLEFWRTEGET